MNSKRSIAIATVLISVTLSFFAAPNATTVVHAENCGSIPVARLLGPDWRSAYTSLRVVCQREARGGGQVNCGVGCNTQSLGSYVVVENYQIFRQNQTGTEVYIFQGEDGAAMALYGDDKILLKYLALQGQRGGLGWPINSDLKPGYSYDALPGTLYVPFQHGGIFFAPGNDEAFAVYGAIWEYYKTHGGWNRFGIPTTDEYSYNCNWSKPCRTNLFSKNYFIAWRPDGKIWSGIPR